MRSLASALLVGALAASLFPGAPHALAAGGISVEPRHDMAHARSHVRLAAAGDRMLYAVGGYIGGSHGVEVAGDASVERYDPANDTWTAREPMPTARLHHGLALATNGKLYAIGGSSWGANGAELKANEEYDPLANTWTVKAPLLTARTQFAAAAAPNGKIYVFGGWNGQNLLDTVEEYDPATNTWTNCAPTWDRCAPMGHARYRHGAAAAADGKIYVVGGNGGADFQTGIVKVEVYDPATNTWAFGTDLPAPNVDFGLTARGAQLLMVSGSSSHVDSDQVHEYDTVDETWSELLQVGQRLTRRRDVGVALADDGKLYVVGGASTPVVGGPTTIHKTTEAVTFLSSDDASVVLQSVMVGSRSASVASLALPRVVYSHVTQQQRGTMTLTADDTTDSRQGWNVTVVVSPFTYSGTDRNQDIPARNFAIANAQAPVRAAGQAIDPISGPRAVTPTCSLDEPCKVLQAGAGFGSGTYTQALDVALSIPAESRVGLYTGILTTTIAAGPS